MKSIGLHIQNLLGLLEEPKRFTSSDDALKAIAEYTGQEVPTDTLKKVNEELNRLREGSLVPHIVRVDKEYVRGKAVRSSFETRYDVYYSKIRS